MNTADMNTIATNSLAEPNDLLELRQIDDQSIEVIRHLVQACRDGEQGYQTAAEQLHATDPLHAELMGFSVDRGHCAAELEMALAELGVSSDASGSVTGALHRGWINLRQALATKEHNAILAECIRGEESAVNQYDQASLSSMPAGLAGLIQKQAREIAGVLARIKNLAYADSMLSKATV